MNHARLLLCASLVLTLLTIPPTTQAIVEPNTWTTSSLAALTGSGTATMVDIDAVDGTAKLGMLALVGGQHKFLRCDTECQLASNWVLKNGNIGALGDNSPRVAWTGGTNWIIAAANGNPSTCTHRITYRTSSDDGATWSVAINSDFGGDNPTLLDIDSPGVVGTWDILVATRSGSCTGNEVISIRHTTDNGVALIQYRTISDNQGGTASPTSTIAIARRGAIIYDSEPLTNPNKIAVAFTDTTNKPYVVRSDDGLFWTVPFTTNGGSTPNPLPTTTCPTDQTAAGNLAYTGTYDGSDVITWPRKDGANAIYACSGNSVDGAVAQFPNANPSPAIDLDTTAGNIGASNGVQHILAYAQGTANKVAYRASASATWSVVYTDATADTNLYAVAATIDHAYFAFAVNGGPVKIAGADMEAPVGGPGRRFCADTGLGAANDWGYDYKEDVSFATTEGDFGIVDGFYFSLPDGDQGYLGKGFNPGSTAFRTNFRVEAGSEGADSFIRVAYTTGATLLQEGSTGDTGADMTAAGNGQTTGNFAQNVQATMEESGDHWIARIRYADGGSLTTLTSANINLDPNAPATYAFIANSTDTTLTLWTVNEATGQPETNLLFTNVPLSMEDLEWRDAWIIATGTTAIAADTVIDEPESGDNDDSTCIFDLIGTSEVIGTDGVQNPSSINFTGTSTTSTSCSSFLCTDNANVPSGFTAATFNFFLGLLMTIAVAAGFWFLSKSPLIMGVGALVGYLMAWAFGLVALWPLVLIAVLGVAVIFLKARPSGG